MATRKKTRKTTVPAPRRRTAALAFDAIAVEGGLLSPDWLTRIAQLAAPQQTGPDYRVPKGLNVREEISRYWRIAQALRGEFEKGLAAKDSGPLAEQFVTALLRECFGFASLSSAEPVLVNERSYPIGHAAVSGRVPVVIAPAAAGLDERLAALGDSGRKRSAFGLAQEFLNAAEGAQWGLATDGQRLRLLRDNASLTRPAWIEADLARIFSEERYAEFTALWLLCHETRFGAYGAAPADSPLESWRAAGREEGTRAREHLRLGVEQAILALGEGFLANPANTALKAALHHGVLSRHGYFQELLRLVYRMIFLLTVEERGLLHSESAPDEARARYAAGYALRRLRERAVRRSAHDRFHDLWDGLAIVFRGLAAGEPLLGLPALAGLFRPDQCPNLDAARLENRHLLLAIFRLAWLKNDGGIARVNWRDMGPEELGSVYESLLELVPCVDDNCRVFSFATGAETKGNARKTTGSYYTPDSLVQVLLDSALEPVVADTITKNPEAAAEALLELTIVDPACGSGHFLLAAARRLAAHVARLTTNGTPSAADYRHALRQVVGRCIFGVDRNPMAVELCKVSLWMEAVEPGLPLSFLDSHIQHGNSLLGTTPELMAKGIPDEAWNPIEGDDKKIASALKKRNKKSAKGQRALDLFSRPSDAEVKTVARAVTDLDAASDTSPEGLAKKESAWEGILGSAEYRHQKLVADAWCAAFVWPKQPGPFAETAPTNDVWRQLRDGQGNLPELIARTICDLARQYGFFHWHLQFPQVFGRGGFHVVLGNPPWEQVLLNEEEWFAQRHPEIAAAPNSAAREALIEGLGSESMSLVADFAAAVRAVDGEAAFVRNSGAYPITGRGRINTYSLFQERVEKAVHPVGRVGVILPTGALTDFSQAGVTAVLVREARLATAFDFENGAKADGGKWFPSVHSQTRFVLLAFAGRDLRLPRVNFAASCVSVADARVRSMGISSDLIARISPNTETVVLFHAQPEIAIAERMLECGIFLGSDVGASLGISFAQPFNASSDSRFFRMAEDLGVRNVGLLGVIRVGDTEWWPLLEGKCGERYNHRFGSFEGATRAIRERKNAGAPELSEERLAMADVVSVPRYWVLKDDAYRAGAEGGDYWQLLYRFSAYPENERTMIAWIAPGFPSTHIAPRILLPDRNDVEGLTFLVAALNSFAYDFFVRRRMSRQGLDFFIVKQTVVPRAGRLAEICVSNQWITERVLELSYVAWDLMPFAQDVDYYGPPFRWDSERRFFLRAELDAAFFHLYGLSRENANYVMDTFPIVRRNDERDYGEYRTKRVILETYDAMAEAIQAGKHFETRLDPPPADARLTHPPRAQISPVEIPHRPKLTPEGDGARFIWAALHVTGGMIELRELAFAYALRSEPKLLVDVLEKQQHQQASQARLWRARADSQRPPTGYLTALLAGLGERSAVARDVNERGRPFVAATDHTPDASEIEAWYLFEAKLCIEAARSLSPVESKHIRERLKDEPEIMDLVKSA